MAEQVPHREVLMMITVPVDSLGSLKHFFHDKRDVMFRYIVREIGKGMEDHAHRINLFQWGESNLVTVAYHPQFGLLLTQALDHFKKKELYEDAAYCRDLLRLYHHDGDVQAVDIYLTELDTEK